MNNNRLVFYLQNQLINPKNRDDISLDFSTGNFSSKEFLFTPTVSISQNEIVLAAPEDRKIYTDWVIDHPTEGLPLRIIDSQTGLIIMSDTDTCLDVTMAMVEPDQITLPIKDRKALFIQKAEAFYLQSLTINKQITSKDFQKVNYNLSEVPEYIKTALLTLFIYQTAREVINKTTKIIAATAGLPFTTGTLAVEVAELILLLWSLYENTKAFINALFPIPKYYNAVRYKKLFETIAQVWGMDLQTNLFEGSYKYLTTIPKKSYPGAIVGQSSNDNGLPDKSFSDILESFCKIFNAKAVFKNDTLEIKRIDDYLNTPNGVIIPDFRQNNGREYPYKVNDYELPKNVLFSFERDTIDQHTYKSPNYVSQLYCDVQNTQNDRFDLSKGLMNIRPQVAKAVRKNDQGFIEKLLAKLFDFVMFATGNSVGLNGNRVGFMQLSSDAIGVDKIALVNDDATIHLQNDSLLNAETIIKENYAPFVTLKTNRWRIYESVRLSFTINELLAFFENPVCQNLKGEKVIIEEAKYELQTDMYVCSLRVQEPDNENIKEVYSSV
jgi:hypothetical protein